MPCQSASSTLCWSSLSFCPLFSCHLAMPNLPSQGLILSGWNPTRPHKGTLCPAIGNIRGLKRREKPGCRDTMTGLATGCPATGKTWPVLLPMLIGSQVIMGREAIGYPATGNSEWLKMRYGRGPAAITRPRGQVRATLGSADRTNWDRA